MKEQELKGEIKQLEDIMQLLFEKYVPNNKKGAFIREYNKLRYGKDVEPPSATDNSQPRLIFLD